MKQFERLAKVLIATMLCCSVFNVTAFAANTIQVNEGSSSTVNMGSLSSTTQYVFKFDAPCHFNGWVEER